MATQFPFSLAENLLGPTGFDIRPPGWVVDEFQHRLVLFFNHVLMQELEARERLVRQRDRRAVVAWRGFQLPLRVTAAGLFELDAVDPPGAADLSLTLTEGSPVQLAQALLRGEKPPVRVEGDVQFAAEINWLVDHVRWDAEEDLSRLVGDAPAHALASVARQAAVALRQFARDRAGTGPDKAVA